jgi:hypothetical protein
MIPMSMVAFSTVGRVRVNGINSLWRIGSTSLEDITFPSGNRIAELWREHVKDGGELAMIGNSGSNYILVEIPKGIKPKRRQPFIEALSHEVTAA